MDHRHRLKKELPVYIRLVIALAGIVLVVIVMREAKSVLVPLLISGFLAILVSPFTSWLEKKGIPSILAVFTGLLAILVFAGGLLFFFYNQILRFSRDLGGIEARTEKIIESLNSFIEKNMESTVPISMESLKDTLFQQIYENIDSLTQGVIATAGTVTMIFIMPVYIFLFLYFRRFLAEFVKKAFPHRSREKVTNVLEKVKFVVQNYIKGMFIVICILAILNSIALISIGVDHALLFAAFAAILNVIPFLGPFLGALFPIVYTLLATDSLWYPFGVFLAFYVIQLAESNFFTPKIVGGKVSMNPLMTIIALFVGNFIWGLAGMVLFIPGIAVLKVILDEIEGMEAYGFLLGTIKPDSASNNKTEKSLLHRTLKRARNRSKGKS